MARVHQNLRAVVLDGHLDLLRVGAQRDNTNDLRQHSDGTWPEYRRFFQETMGQLAPELRTQYGRKDVMLLYGLI